MKSPLTSRTLSQADPARLNHTLGSVRYIVPWYGHFQQDLFNQETNMHEYQEDNIIPHAAGIIDDELESEDPALIGRSHRFLLA